MNSTEKKNILKSAAEELQNLIVNCNSVDIVMQLHIIIGDLTFEGYCIARCKLRGFSHQQCAIKLGITKEKVRYYYEKCVELQHDIALKTLLVIK